jgi:hypothetical protein
LHDILCLANSYSNSDRYLVFGVADDHSVTGVAADINRKTNANLQDFLRQANLNRIPTCVIEQHDVGGGPHRGSLCEDLNQTACPRSSGVEHVRPQSGHAKVYIASSRAQHGTQNEPRCGRSEPGAGEAMPSWT